LHEIDAMKQPFRRCAAAASLLGAGFLVAACGSTQQQSRGVTNVQPEEGVDVVPNQTINPTPMPIREGPCANRGGTMNPGEACSASEACCH
jgi:hypothetical protein